MAATLALHFFFFFLFHTKGKGVESEKTLIRTIGREFLVSRPHSALLLHQDMPA